VGSKTIEIRYCDKCEKEIVGRLTLHTCPVCGKDICVECQEKEDAKHKPRERKAKAEPEPTLGDMRVRGGRVEHYVKAGKDIKVRTVLSNDLKQEIVIKKGDNLSIHVPTGIDDDTEYKVNIAGFETTGATLRVAVLAVLEDKFNGKIPDCLSEQERETIKGILDAGSISDPRD